MSFIGGAIDGDTLVIHLDLFGRFKIVIDDHLLTASDKRLADLDRGEPVNTDVRDTCTIEEQGDMGHVFRRADHVARSCRRNRNGLLIQDIMDDRNVVYRQIPDHIDVALEQAEARARAVVVIDTTKLFLE